MNDLFNKCEDADPTKSFMDVYATYQDGVREVKVSVAAKSHLALWIALTLVGTFVIAGILIQANQFAYATLLTGAIWIGLFGAVWVFWKPNAKTREKSDDETPHPRVKPEGERPPRRIAG